MFWADVKALSRPISVRSFISAERWFDHFKSLFSSSGEGNAKDDVANDDVYVGEQIIDDELDSPISEEEVEAAIHSLKNKKAPGVDGILNEMLKSSLHVIKPFIIRLFNQIWDTGIFPKEWQTSIIIPLHKKGKQEDPNNYRGISLISNVCKCFTFIINNRLKKWAYRNNIIVEEQAGYRAGYSTIDQFFVLYGVIQRVLARKKMYVCFVDFQKAYDTVDRKQLWKVLTNQKVSSKMVSCLMSMYAEVKSCVRVSNSEYTDLFECNNGLKQGCMCSPLLFSFFINELALEL